MIQKICRNDIRKRKHARVRRKISGTPERPRLCIFRSLTHMYAQIIDDTTGQTLASASTLDKEIKEQIAYGGNIAGAAAVGSLIAARAQDKGIATVVFDRGGYIYHGRVAALAEAARKAGLNF
jgi:large subunit ribosomal protein L18